MSKPKPTPKTSDKRRHFDAAFKLQSAQLAKQIGFRQAAADLGVSEGNLRNWEKSIATHGQLAFAPLAQRDDVASELKRLREENRILKMERDILKKGIFTGICGAFRSIFSSHDYRAAPFDRR